MKTTLLSKKSFDISYKPVGQFEETRFEKIHNVIFDSSSQASIIVAQEIAELIRKKTTTKFALCFGPCYWFISNTSI